MCTIETESYIFSLPATDRDFSNISARERRYKKKKTSQTEELTAQTNILTKLKRLQKTKRANI